MNLILNKSLVLTVILGILLSFVAPAQVLAQQGPTVQPINPGTPPPLAPGIQTNATTPPISGASLCSVISKGISNLGETIRKNIGGIIGSVTNPIGNWLRGSELANTISNAVRGVASGIADALGLGGFFNAVNGIVGAAKKGSEENSVPVNDAALRANLGKIVQKEVGTGGTKLFPPCDQMSLNRIAIIASRALIKKITDETVTWINNGFDGKPAYAVEPGKFLQNSADAIAGNFISDLSNGFLCQPFRLVVQHSLIEDYKQRFPNNDTYAQQQQCTLSNVANFYRGDFSNGGWHSWFAMAKPENTPTGAYLMAQQQLSLKLAGNKEITLAQLNWNRGFLSVPDGCKRYGPDRYVQDGFGPTGEPEFKTVKGACEEPGPIKTPGAVIEANLEKVLGHEIEDLQLVDDFDAIIGALYNYMNKRVFSTVNGLFTGGADQDTPTFYYEGDTSEGISSNPGANNGGCSVTPSNALVGDAVTWGVPSSGEWKNAKFIWTGTNVESRETTAPQISISYTSPGQKNMSIQAEYDIEDLSNPICSTNVPVIPPGQGSAGQEPTTTCTYPLKHVGPEQLSCAQTVTVAQYKPITASCVPNMQRARVNRDVVIYTITVDGGSGTLYDVHMDGDQHEVTWLNFVGSAGFMPMRPDGTFTAYRNNSPVVFSRESGKTILKFGIMYTRKQDVGATARVLDADQTLDQLSNIDCTPNGKVIVDD